MASNHDGLQAFPYSETTAADPPVQLSSSNLQQNQNAALESSLKPSQIARSYNLDECGGSTQDTSQGVPQIRIHDESKKSKYASFHGLNFEVSTSGLSDDIATNKMEFSNRGSMLIDGKRLNSTQFTQPLRLQPIPDQHQPRTPPSRSLSTKPVSTDEELLSEKVRSFYTIGSDNNDIDAQSSMASRMGQRWQDTIGNEGSVMTLSRATSTTDVHEEDRLIQREENELAGGIEDWQDVEIGDVDRYGFIVPRTEGIGRKGTYREGQTLQRVSTSLQLASETPRRKHTVRRSPSTKSQPSVSTSPITGPITGFERSLRRPKSSESNKSRTFRSATNRLPQNKDRRLLDEAADMLTMPRTAKTAVEQGQTTWDDSRARKKEVEREEKWRKMARQKSVDPQGGGMVFDFDTTNSKLIERTWKGIPDKWRATAWHSFLSASASKRGDQLSEADLVVAFHGYQGQSSPDDVQIDLDVPRTISSHIMFRRRYRGGQRLLFRVLHAMSLHFAEIGYVQGMAALAATLLAYYEEEKAFVMLVRLWDLRGLERLYKSGFGGLMQALDDFEKHWLGEGELAKKLTDLGIGPTAYGTRWYLTLFNYSIPFPAQLRVWDVFMLLGDDPDTESFGSTLDVLHATSAALIDGMRDILLESDFENAMKVLTSWVPVRDEDLFMRVARAEWKMHKKLA